MKKIAIITHIWHRAKFYCTCISDPWYLIMVPNLKTIHPAIKKKCTKMDIWVDRWMEGWTDGGAQRWMERWIGPFPIFTNSTCQSEE